MISVIQRVTRAEVRVEGRVIGRVGTGLVALVAVMDGDGDDDVAFTADRLEHLRVFADDQGKMNHSVQDVGGSLLLVSQFTLAGDTRKGRRPSFTRAAGPGEARRRFDQLVGRLEDGPVPVETGEFAAHMEVDLVNDGPVTLILDSWESRRGHYHDRSEEES